MSTLYIWSADDDPHEEYKAYGVGREMKGIFWELSDLGDVIELLQLLADLGSRFSVEFCCGDPRDEDRDI